MFAQHLVDVPLGVFLGSVDGLVVSLPFAGLGITTKRYSYQPYSVDALLLVEPKNKILEAFFGYAILRRETIDHGFLFTDLSKKHKENLL